MSDLRLHQCRIENRYDILDCLGRGSYAEIYVARDATTVTSTHTPQLVVIKALNTSLQGTPDPDLERTLIENFHNEAVALDRVRHPNIISRLGGGAARDLAGRAFNYILLEYMPGGDLAALCRKRPLDVEHALYYLQQVCAGLAHAHERDVIHRDIKPQNLLLTADRQTIKIADFGVAKIKMLEEAAGTITRVGTDIYAPPEHHPLAVTTSHDSASLVRSLEPTILLPAADVYSLAKTVYMILTGETPRRFAGRSVTDLPASLNDKSWAAAALEVLRRATQASISARHQTVAEFWTELTSAVQGRRPTIAVTEKVDRAAGSNGDHAPREHDGREAGKNILVDTQMPPAQAQTATEESHQLKESPPERIAHTQANKIAHEQTNHIAQEQAMPLPMAEASRSRIEVALPRSSEIVMPLPMAEASRSRFTVSVADARNAESDLSTSPNAPQNTAVNPVVAAQREIHRKKNSRLSNFAARWLIGLLIVVSFAGMLWATRYYVQRIRSRSSVVQTNSPVGREFITTHNVNLRTDPTAATSQNITGEVRIGSRVRVREVRGNWYQVEVGEDVIQNRRSNFDGSGWVDSNFLRPI